MIPIQDSPLEPRRTFPVVMLLLTAANIALFAYELSLGPNIGCFVRAYGAMPAEITTGRGLVPGAPSPIYLTLLTSMFIHGGILHVGGNMLFLWVFGDNVEDALGHLVFLGFYLFCGVIAGLAQVVANPFSSVPSIGASGAIAGVLAAYLVLFPDATVRTLLLVGPFITFTRISALFMIGVWIVLQLASALLELTPVTTGSGVAFWAHLGGFGAGFLVTLAWRGLMRERRVNSE